MKVLQQRISDRKLLGLIARFLKVDILNQEGSMKESTVGTPQGSVMSPILSNIFLNTALDQWFIQNYASNDAVIVRYADDAVCDVPATQPPFSGLNSQILSPPFELQI
jgi:retron-type reverse transcriptase